MSQLITINLSKGPGASWGFRLQGGKDFAQPLCIQKVNVGSVAESAGLAAGDAIVSIGSSDALMLRHKEAQDTIVKAGGSFQMVVQRGAMSWKPQVTALAQPKKTPEGLVATETSLAAPGKQPTKRAPKAFNAAPAGYGEVNGQPIVNPQYNTPINLYNEDNIAEALSAQSEVLGKGCLGINFRKFDREVKLRTDSPTYLLIHGDGDGAAAAAAPPKPRKQLPPPSDAPQQDKPLFPAAQPGQGSGVSSPVPSSMPAAAGPTKSVQAPVTKTRPEGASPITGAATLCAQCDMPIIGVFVRIKDKNLHADCFKCNTCGSSLKNVGYYNINDKMYCDTHAKQAAKHSAPGPNMVPVTVKPGAAPPAGAVAAPLAMFKPPGGVRLFPSSSFGGPATPYKRPF